VRAKSHFDIPKRSKVFDARALELHWSSPGSLLLDLDRLECKGNYNHPDRHRKVALTDKRASAAAQPALERTSAFRFSPESP
jgi:hypothetical protein